MTDIIDTIHLNKPQFNTINLRKRPSLGQSKNSLASSQTLTIKQKESLFSVIIKQNHCPYDLLVIINPQNVFAMLKVSLIQKCGNLLKIQEQQSKTYLIRKFLAVDNLYRLQIDPFSGEVYFRLDYFELKTFTTPLTKNQKNEIFKSLNLAKLYQTVEKFVAFYQCGQWNSCNQTELPFKDQYEQLAKAVCTIDTADFLHNFRSNYDQRDEEQFQAMAQLLIEKKSELGELQKYLTQKKQTQKQPLNKNLLKKQIKDIELENTKIGAQTKRKYSKSNLEVLQISKDTEKKLKEVISSMIEEKVPKHIMKIVQNEFGNIIINLQRQHQTVYSSKIEFLQHLPKDIEYMFLDRYFLLSGCSFPILISTCLKEQPLDRYIAANSISLSIETKMRILLQIFNAVHTLWEDRQILLYTTGFKRIALTKSMVIKIRNINHHDKIDMFMMYEDKTKVNVKLLDNWLNLSKMYFKLFFCHCLVKPSPTTVGEGEFVEQLKPIASAKRFVGTKFLPEVVRDPIKEIIMGMNYIFMSFIDKAYKIIISFVKRAGTQRDPFNQEEQEYETEGQLALGKERLYSYKLTSCWLYKNFEFVTKEAL